MECSQNTAFAVVVIYKALKSKFLDCAELEPGRGGGLQKRTSSLEAHPDSRFLSPSWKDRHNFSVPALPQNPSPLTPDPSHASPRGV